MTRTILLASLSLALGAGLAGGHQLAADAAPAKAKAKPPAKCSRTALPGEFRCSLPTHSNKRAVLYVQTFEDGSIKVYPVDPDKRGIR